MICEALWVTAIINKLSITMLHEVLTSSYPAVCSHLEPAVVFTRSRRFLILCSKKDINVYLIRYTS